VGLIGKKRVGKDTFAAVLVEEFGFARVAFADPLKEMALTIDPIIHVGNGWDDDGLAYGLGELIEQRGWEAVKDHYPAARRFLQRLGDGVRQFDPEFWVRAGMEAAESQREGYRLHPVIRKALVDSGNDAPADRDPRPVVVTDVRYPNEADAIRDAGGILVRIVRPGVDDGDTHASETALDDYDADLELINDGGVFDLQEGARGLAEGLTEAE
jgi:hypothetical protein